MGVDRIDNSCSVLSVTSLTSSSDDRSNRSEKIDKSCHDDIKSIVALANGGDSQRKNNNILTFTNNLENIMNLNYDSSSEDSEQEEIDDDNEQENVNGTWYGKEGDTTTKLKGDSNESVTKKVPGKQQRRSSLRRSSSNSSFISGHDNGNSRRGISTRSNVSFGSIEVHEFEFELGGSALPTTGPSIVLSRRRSSYTRHESIDDLDDLLNKEKGNVQSSIKNKKPNHLPAQQRIDRLLKMGYSMGQINASIRENAIARHQRRRSAAEAMKKQQKNGRAIIPKISFRNLFSKKKKKKEATE